MKLFSLSVFGLALLLTAMAPALKADSIRPQEAAQAAAEPWLALMDANKYAECWQKSASLFQQAIGKDRFVEGMGIRAPFGNVKSRKLVSAKLTQTMPGAPDGEYVILQYETVFEHKKSAVETITPVKDKDGVWKVSGYFIK